MLKNLLNRILPGSPASSGQPPVVDDTASSDRLIDEGNQLEDGGDPQRAEVLYRQAVDAAPRHARAHLNLGIVLAARGDNAGAGAAYEAVLAIDPHHPFGNYNFARLAYVREDLQRAETLLREALRAKPEFPQALVLLANVLDERGKTGAAIETADAALRLQPEDAGAWYNLGVMLRKERRLDEADAAAKRAFAIDGRSDALRLMSVVLRDHGFMALSLEPLRAAIASEPERLGLLSEELLVLNFDEDVTAADLFARHVEFGRRLEQSVPARFRHSRANDEPARRLRIGYVSGDFYTHPVTMFMLPILERHDRAAFEIFCYSSGAKSDVATLRSRQLSDHWLEAKGLSDTQLADAIHADGIDILVDLTGHTQHSRLATFSQRPAPVQVAWLGYLNTTGLTRMDYRLCDRRTDPADISQPLHTEKLAWLPESQWCYRPFLNISPAPAAPCETNGYITFGSFNNAPKITDIMCRRWAQVLARTPGSRLRVADIASERKRAAIRAEFERQGVDAGRIDFAPRVSMAEYFKSFGLVDIALDTFPYGGGTTTLDALWMGVPVVAARGSTPVSRSAASVLALLGMDEWIAPSVEDQVELAVKRAADPQAVAALRRSLRQSLEASPLTDEARFVADLERLYRELWSARGA